MFWKSTSIDDLIFRSSLIKVDGFDNANQFEDFVSKANFDANSLLLKNDPERFNLKYNEIDSNTLQKQT